MTTVTTVTATAPPKPRAERRAVLGLRSAGLYAVVQVFEVNLPSWPLDGSWYFNPLAWQLIFALGVFVGRRAKSGGIGYDRRLYALCLAVVVSSAFVATDGDRDLGSPGYSIFVV